MLGALAVLCLGLPSASIAQEEVWNCEFKGSWTQEREDQGPFTWKVTWIGKGEKCKIAGTGEDSLGKFSTTGDCGARKCDITQTYTSGEQKDKNFYWSGNYQDEETTAENVLKESFSGTWGFSAKDRKTGGTWKAKAVCNR